MLGPKPLPQCRKSMHQHEVLAQFFRMVFHASVNQVLCQVSQVRSGESGQVSGLSGSSHVSVNQVRSLRSGLSAFCIRSSLNESGLKV